jgi:hypothetical protein
VKLSRNELVAKLSNKINPTNSFEEMADSILKELQNLGLITSTKRKEIVVRKDMECMPYDDEVIVEEFGN